MSLRASASVLIRPATWRTIPQRPAIRTKHGRRKSARPIAAFVTLRRAKPPAVANICSGDYLCRYVIRPFVKSYGDISTETLSPFMILIRFRRSLPPIVARTVLPTSSSMENIPALNFSTTLPVTSIASSFGKFFLYKRTKNEAWHVSVPRRVPNPSLTNGFAASRRDNHRRRPMCARPSAELR
jgi:hypothetical protein